MSRVYKSTCPCKDCPNKGCGPYHDKCEDFKNWKQNSVEADTNYYKYTPGKVRGLREGLRKKRH